jgi:hypothetical protein
MFELRGRFGVARQKLVKMMRGSEKENMSACSSSGGLATGQQENALPSVNHSLEAELEKAQAQALVYYRRMLDTPK